MKANFEKILSVLDKEGVVSFAPVGDSMWPFLQDKKQSVIIKKKQQRLNVYDVALFIDGDDLVLHRVLALTDEGYYIMGDGNFSGQYVEENMVVGVMDSFVLGDKTVKCDDKDYLKQVENWYKDKHRNFKLKVFKFKRKLKRCFTKK